MQANLLNQSQPFGDACEAWGLDRRIAKAVARLGFKHATIVQEKCVPLALQGRDLLVRARTGSGKTLAYALPMIQKVLATSDGDVGHARARGAPRRSRALVLVPTRELCMQVERVVSDLLLYARDAVRVVAVAGGTGSDPIDVQRARLAERPDVIIATPGRLVAHLKSEEFANLIKTSVETLIVDEADLIFSYGYSDDVRTIVSALPRSCQSFLMSATLTDEIDSLKRVVLNSPAIVKLEEGQSDGILSQFFVRVNKQDKDLLMFALMQLKLVSGKKLFFVNSVERCYYLKLLFEQFSIRAAVLNAELPVNSREHILQEFNKGLFDNLIATDDAFEILGARATVRETDKGGKEFDDDDDEEEEEEEEDEEEEGGKEAKDRRRRSSADSASDDEEEDDDDDEDDDEEDAELGDQASSSDAGSTDPSDDESHAVAAASSAARERARQAADSEFGVTRGLDFQGVSTVINVDFPRSVQSYTHRIGRTARGGESGTALSIVDETEVDMLAAVQAAQSFTSRDHAGGSGEAAHQQANPAPLDLDLGEIEGFRYRVEDVRRRVTRKAIREARLRELKQEMLNSEKLRAHFEKNPKDLHLLQHDAALKPSVVAKHVAHIPDYLMPANLVADTGNTLKPTSRRGGGRALSGRMEWKRRHGKGPFSKKRRGGGGGAGDGQKRRKKKDPLFG